MRLHNDQPVLIDQLARRELVETIGRAASHGDPPLVFGIHGDWGLGKTSILQQVHYFLAQDCPDKVALARLSEVQKKALAVGRVADREGIQVVWFEAWRYQNEPVPVVALLHEIRNQIVAYYKFTNQARKLGEVAIRGALLSIEEVTKALGFQASKVEQAGKDWEAAHLASTLSSNTIRQHLCEAIQALLPPDGPKEHRRVVVIIDDLDRCEPEAAFRLLEGMKLYLTLPNCVFILGMNQQIVEDAIAKHVPGNDAAVSRERAGAYLEKLCHNIWRVPAVRDPKTLLLSLLPECVYRDWVDEAIDDLRCLPPNPRRLKGLANLLIRLGYPVSTTGKPSDEDLHQTRLHLIVALVYQFHHDLYRHWESHPALYNQIRDWCRGERRAIGPTGIEAGRSSDPAGDTGSKKSPPVDPLDQIFNRLRPAVRALKDSSSATQLYSVETAFPDPSDPGIFWAQPLILAAEDGAVELRQELGSADFLPYLHPTASKK